MNTLTLHASGWIGDGPLMEKWATVIRYDVRGLPPGEQAWIADFHHAWHVLRVKDGVQGHWTGDFKTAEDALAAI
jgi:hypothetical protein